MYITQKEGCSHANLQVSPNTFLAQRATLLKFSSRCVSVTLKISVWRTLQDSGHIRKHFAIHETLCACFWWRRYKLVFINTNARLACWLLLGKNSFEDSFWMIFRIFAPKLR